MTDIDPAKSAKARQGVSPLAAAVDQLLAAGFADHLITIMPPGVQYSTHGTNGIPVIKTSDGKQHSSAGLAEGRMTVVSGGSLRVIDGDTVALGEEHIRLRGPDAPELYKARCANERRVAIEAQRILTELLKSRSITISRHGADKYARTLAELAWPDRTDVGQLMIARGVAVPWRPGRDA